MTLAEISRIAPPTGRKRQYVWLSKVTRVLVGTLHGDALGLLAGFAIEQLVRRQSREGTAHLDTREACLSCRASRVGRSRRFWIKTRHGGKGPRRSWPISRSILANSVRDMATSAS